MAGWDSGPVHTAPADAQAVAKGDHGAPRLLRQLCAGTDCLICCMVVACAPMGFVDAQSLLIADVPAIVQHALFNFGKCLLVFVNRFAVCAFAFIFACLFVH